MKNGELIAEIEKVILNVDLPTSEKAQKMSYLFLVHKGLDEVYIKSLDMRKELVTHLGAMTEKIRKEIIKDQK